MSSDSLRRKELQINWYSIKTMFSKMKITLESILLQIFEKNRLVIKASKIIPNKLDMYNPNFTTS